ncbi:T9SS type A sorting domain-containing protein [Flavobacterium sp. MAH-1]|uniref:T9SS type A sorting domain-containing protein n=1 Tax=Flavobacterium agri TaxID=2743471 RepID=A0A7Y8Y1J9_9FLAO|nr:T9SS type A sorting domain-containing protein [Flavobacterium agri]NUY80844.1 T9SS type A sorting domain-containing protein [Flavobacterium agri]NYA70868.1 T9SS type A sorting domain-containing protein [Flavobacterium agri]
MKKLYFLLLLCSGLALAQPDINASPQPLAVCDDNGDGFGMFDLTMTIPEILNGLNPSEYTVTFHQTLSDANSDGSFITIPSAYSGSDNQILYVRVEEIANPTEFAVAHLDLVVYLPLTGTISAAQTNVCMGSGSGAIQLQGFGGAGFPYTFTYSVNGGANQTVTTTSGDTVYISLPDNLIATYDFYLYSVVSGCESFPNQNLQVNVVEPAFAYPASDIVVSESPNDGYATFDLTTNNTALVGGQSNVTVSFYTSEADAQNGNNPIVPVTAWPNGSNPETIWARVQSNSSTCASVTSFDLVVMDTDVVYIPDPVFKNALITAGIDTNTDGNIQFSEAAVVTTLTVDNLNIQDLTGVKSFTSLINLYAMDNMLTSLDLSGMTTLQLAYLGGNELTSINLFGVSNLEDLVLDQNHLTSLSLQNMPNLDRFSIMYNQVSNLVLSNIPQVREINVYGNQLTSLDVSTFTNLEILSCAANDLATLNVIGATSLKTLDFSSNNVANVNVAGMSSLQTLYFNDNPVQSHDWTGLSSLKYLQFGNTGISTVDLPPSSTLLTLDCRGNAIANLDVSVYPSVTNLDCRNNNLTTLDVTTLEDLVFLNCSDNNITGNLDLNNNTNLEGVSIFGNNIEMLFAKNGAEENLTVGDLTENSLVYVCADEDQVASYQAMAGVAVQVNSYCSFVPGGVYNTITGNVKFDSAGNGCDASDSAQSLIKVHMTHDSDEFDVFTDNQAAYNFYVGDGDYTVNPVFENNYFNTSPSAANVNFAAVDGTISTNDFCLTANGINPDAEIAVFPVIPARPGFDAVYRIVIRNKGNQTLSQTYGISFFYDDSVMDFVSSTVTPASSGTGSLNWNYANLQPFESRSIEVTVNINAPTDSPAINIDDQLTFTANINATGDVDSADNTFAYTETVVGSFDPNDKKCLEGEIVSPMLIGDYLHYVINFENTGNAPAENITIKDVIDPTMFDRSSLVIMGSSHHVVAKSGDDGTIFIFQSINLDSGGHGNILLRVRTLGSLHEGDVVSNKADIYFDYNHPIITNTAHTTFQSLSVDDPKDVSVELYPNPVDDSFTVKADNEIRSLQLFDIQGRLLQVKMIDANQTTMNISDRQTGVYFVKITTDKGVKVEKIVKK